MISALRVGLKRARPEAPDTPMSYRLEGAITTRLALLRQWYQEHGLTLYPAYIFG